MIQGLSGVERVTKQSPAAFAAKEPRSNRVTIGVNGAFEGNLRLIARSLGGTRPIHTHVLI